MKKMLMKTAKAILIGVSVLAIAYGSSQWVSAQSITEDPPIPGLPYPPGPPPTK